MKLNFDKLNFDLNLNLDRNPTLARLQSLPLAGRIAVGAIALLLAWVALEQWSWSWARQWSQDADHIEQVLTTSSELASNADATAVIGAELFGPINPPASESEGAEQMAKAVVDVVKKHVAHFSYDAQRASSRLSGSGGATIAGNQKLSKVTGDVQFEATPEETAKIIAELEANPAIEAINSLRIQRKDADRKVAVRLTVEAWVYAARTTGRMN